MVQYCYTLPEIYGEYYDNYDDDDSYYHVDTDFNAENTIRFSKACSGDWYKPGYRFQDRGSKSQYHFFKVCGIFESTICAHCIISTILNPDHRMTMETQQNTAILPGLMIFAIGILNIYYY